MRSELYIAHVGVLGGERRDDTEWSLVIEPQLAGAAARRDRLVAHISGARGPEARDSARLVLRTLRTTFLADSSGSVTGALRKALFAANAALYERNMALPADRRCTLGLSVVALRENELYVAQAAPAFVVLRGRAAMRVFPTLSGVRPSEPRANALGSSLTIEPELFRANVATGDTLVLCSAAEVLRVRELLSHADSALDADALAAELAATLLASDTNQAEALVAQLQSVLSPQASAQPFGRVGVAERSWLALRDLGGQLGDGVDGALAVLRNSGARRARNTDARARDERAGARLYQPDTPILHAPDPPALPVPLNLGTPLTLPVRPEAPAAAQSQVLPLSALLGEAPPEVLLASMMPMPATPQDTADRQTTRGDDGPFGPAAQRRDAARVASRRRDRRERKKSQSAFAQQSRATGLSYRRERPPFPWIPLLLLVTLVGGLLYVGSTLTRQETVRVADTSLQRANRAVSALRESPDEAAARIRLGEAAEALAAARASGVISSTADQRTRFAELEAEYERVLAAIDRVTYFDDLVEVTRHPLPGGLFGNVIIPPPPGVITDTLAFGSIYMLDTNGNTLYAASKSGGAARPLLRPDDLYGPLPVGSVYDTAWRFDNIVAVTRADSGVPFTFYFRRGTGWAYSNLAGSEEWRELSEHFRAVNYEGNLYIWGAQPNQLLRYLSGAYGNFPDPWIQNDGGRDLDRIVDLAVDGKVYLLENDGTALVFATSDSGERAFERAIEPPAIDPPVTTITRFFVTGTAESGSIFLIDSYNSRIIQLDKMTGELIQQVRSRTDDPLRMDQITGLFVDESGARPLLYIVNGGQVLRGVLPVRPRPFRDGGLTPQPAPTIAPTAAP